MSLRISLTVICVLLCSALRVDAATHYVRQGATGTGSGADWANAYTDLPAKLTRGDTYYVAAGAFGNRIFEDLESGTLVITIKKATIADHGTETGWQDAYGVGPASWMSWDVARAYYVFDGQTRNADWHSGYGFRVGPSGERGQIDLYFGGGSTADHIVFRYIEVAGNGLDNPTHDIGIYSPGGNDNVLVQYSYIHDVGGTNIVTGFTSGWTLEYSVIARNSSDAVEHAEGWAGSADSNLIVRYNFWEDIEGTGFLVMLNRGSGSGTCTNVEIYGNVFMYSAGNPYNREGTGDGVIVAINDQNAVNWKIYNNSIINVRYGLSSRVEVGGNSAKANSGVLIYNNHWWGSDTAVHVLENCGGCEARYNRYDGTPSAPEDGMEKNTAVSTASFVGYASKDFQLANATASGIGLPAPYNVDLTGAVRGKDGVWDRGAFEYGSAPAGTPSAPINLRRSAD